jgi:RNA polymerase sigma-70 factor (ECF subfamily)
MTGHPGTEEDEIIRSCLAGDTDRYAVLVERYRTLAFTVAFRMLGDGDEANDAAQDSFIAAYGSLKAFRAGSKFSTWLYRIVLNRCQDRLRARRSTVPVEDVAGELRDPRRGPEGAAEEREEGGLLQQALDRLPPDYREALVLKHIEGLSYEEMSEVLGATVGALKVRAHRGRELLRDQLERSGVTP